MYKYVKCEINAAIGRDRNEQEKKCIVHNYNRICSGNCNTVPLKTALKRENEVIAPRARKGSESVLTHGEGT